MANTVVIYGPQKCGKSTNSDALMRHFGCTSVVDDWDTEKKVTPGALHLTTDYRAIARGAKNYADIIRSVPGVVELCKSPRVQTSALIAKIVARYGTPQESPEDTRIKNFLSMPGPDQFTASFDNRRFWPVDIGDADAEECTA